MRRWSLHFGMIFTTFHSFNDLIYVKLICNCRKIGYAMDSLIANEPRTNKIVHHHIAMMDNLLAQRIKIPHLESKSIHLNNYEVILIGFKSVCRICVKQKHVCDGLLDCPNGEDEANCPTINDCPPSSKCEQLCTKKAKGEDGCTCKIGYMLEENGYK